MAWEGKVTGAGLRNQEAGSKVRGSWQHSKLGGGSEGPGNRVALVVVTQTQLVGEGHS